MNARKNAASVAVQAEPCLQSTDRTEAVEADEYSYDQLLMFIEAIACQTNALKSHLLMAKSCRNGAERERLMGAALAMGQSIGCATDKALGASRFGGGVEWVGTVKKKGRAA
ncbi:hypothetical protein P245_06390 [Comamonas thiooxydans]|uniref:Uncharacterized protein n=1 Tax=Comamonas thiooxydans TaxID=363952 RepID=A0A0E3BHU1_9BURK|nr:hypothetical protein [Comamonas thiooxydans]KGG95554.1 hypothetical protein P245_06390 [Comamonas thiooxydans]